VKAVAARSLSRLGTPWEGFTDQVMGGDSRLESALVPGEQGRALRLSGQVSLKNNGGFIQMRLPFAGFRPQNMSGGRLEPGRLLSLAIVAIGREFDAELFVQSVGFYR
jgi:hypothetical protein